MDYLDLFSILLEIEKMKHETLHLNQSRLYVLVNDTWYDTHVDLNPRVGQPFLNGRIDEILDYSTYTERYPDANEEIHSYISEKTVHGGYIRRVVNGMVKYAVNPAVPNSSNISSDYFTD